MKILQKLVGHLSLFLFIEYEKSIYFAIGHKTKTEKINILIWTSVYRRRRLNFYSGTFCVQRKICPVFPIYSTWNGFNCDVL